MLKNLQLKIRVENIRFFVVKSIFCTKVKYGIQSINEIALKIKDCNSISRHQIWCAHAIVVQQMHACACKMPPVYICKRVSGLLSKESLMYKNNLPTPGKSFATFSVFVTFIF